MTLRQEDRPVVVLDSALLKDIDAAFDEIGSDLSGFVLASGSRVFVAGANLEEIMALDDEALEKYLAFGSRVYGRISSLGCPSVAAINGATLGGGLELALHCDVLIALIPEPRDPSKPAKPYQIGLPESGLRICPGWGGTNMLPARMDAGRAIRMTADGRPFTVHEAAEAGLVRELVKGKDALIERAKQIVLSESRRETDEPIAISNSCDQDEIRQGLDRVREHLPRTAPALSCSALKQGCEMAGRRRSRASAQTSYGCDHQKKAKRRSNRSLRKVNNSRVLRALDEISRGSRRATAAIRILEQKSCLKSKLISKR